MQRRLTLLPRDASSLVLTMYVYQHQA